MSFTITISADTGTQAIRELLDAAAFYQGRPEIAHAAEASEKSAPAADPAKPGRKPRAPKDEPAKGADTEKLPEAGQPTGEPTTSENKTEAPAELSLEDLRAELTTYLSDPAKAPLVTAEIQKFGGKLSLVPADKRRELQAAVAAAIKVAA